MFGTSWSFAAVGNHRANGRAEVQIKMVTAALSNCSETLSGDTNWTRRLALLEFTSTDRQNQAVEWTPAASRDKPGSQQHGLLLGARGGGARQPPPAAQQGPRPVRPPPPGPPLAPPSGAGPRR